MKKKSQTKRSADYEVFQDINYICKSTPVIVEALQQGCDVAQMTNGDIVITRVQVVSNYYSWNDNEKRITKTQSCL
jgi:hypothetical protein